MRAAMISQELVKFYHVSNGKYGRSRLRLGQGMIDAMAKSYTIFGP